MKKTKITAWLLTAVLCGGLALSGCGRSTSNVDAEAEDTEPAVVVEDLEPEAEDGTELEPEAEDVDPDLQMGHGPAVEADPEAEDMDSEAEDVDIELETGPGPVIIDDDSDTGDSEFDAAWGVIQGYGFDNDEYSWRDYWSADYDYSPLSFSLTGGTVEDMGDYYVIQAVFNEPVKVPADLEPGESCTVVINGLTGETKTFTCVVEEGTGARYYTTDDGWECYLTAADSDGMAELLEGSSDRLDAPFYDGVLWISKDAVTGAAITDGPFETVTLEGLSEDDWFNVVAFDKNGYVMQLIFEGD